MVVKEEKITYKILQEFKKEQDKLIREGRIQKPQIIYGLSAEGEIAVKRGRTLDDLKWI